MGCGCADSAAKKRRKNVQKQELEKTAAVEYANEQIKALYLDGEEKSEIKATEKKETPSKERVFIDKFNELTEIYNEDPETNSKIASYLLEKSGFTETTEDEGKPKNKYALLMSQLLFNSNKVKEKV